MKLTIVCDNETQVDDVRADWSFAAVVEAHGKQILFDTGASGDLLVHNLQTLGFSTEAIDCVFISHDHWDHTGGLDRFLELRPVPVYVPAVFRSARAGAEFVRVGEAREVAPGFLSTGELGGQEQSLVVELDDGVAVVVGCSHPGVGRILDAAAPFGRARALIGGFHGFNDFSRLIELDQICATHCTQHKQEIRDRFPDKVIPGGAGQVIEV